MAVASFLHAHAPSFVTDIALTFEVLPAGEMWVKGAALKPLVIGHAASHQATILGVIVETGSHEFRDCIRPSSIILEIRMSPHAILLGSSFTFSYLDRCLSRYGTS